MLITKALHKDSSKRISAAVNQEEGDWIVSLYI